jgi:hypothetical protein
VSVSVRRKVRVLAAAPQIVLAAAAAQSAQRHAPASSGERERFPWSPESAA